MSAVRNRAWTVMRALQAQGRRFTATDIAREIRAPLPRVARLMRVDLMRGFVVAFPGQVADQVADQAVAANGMAMSAPASFAAIPMRLQEDAPLRPPRASLLRGGDGGRRKTDRQRAWEAIRAMPGEFGVREIARRSRTMRPLVEALLGDLVLIGFATIVAEPAGRHDRVYGLAERGGAQVPARQLDGSIRDPNDGRRWDPGGRALAPGEPDPLPSPERAWLAMRAIGGTFTVRDITLLAEASVSSVVALIELLVRIRYVLVAQKGVGPRPTHYRLIVRSGPRPPLATSNGETLDPNDGRRWSFDGAELPAVKRGRRA